MYGLSRMYYLATLIAVATESDAFRRMCDEEVKLNFTNFLVLFG